MKYREYRKQKNCKKFFQEEYNEFLSERDKLFFYPVIFDVKVRHTDKSWKSSYKVTKQYMKHRPRKYGDRLPKLEKYEKEYEKWDENYNFKAV